MSTIDQEALGRVGGHTGFDHGPGRHAAQNQVEGAHPLAWNVPWHCFCTSFPVHLEPSSKHIPVIQTHPTHWPQTGRAMRGPHNFGGEIE